RFGRCPHSGCRHQLGGSHRSRQRRDSDVPTLDPAGPTHHGGPTRRAPIDRPGPASPDPTRGSPPTPTRPTRASRPAPPPPPPPPTPRRNPPPPTPPRHAPPPNPAPEGPAAEAEAQAAEAQAAEASVEWVTITQAVKGIAES